jgi:hypothetical protein
MNTPTKLGAYFVGLVVVFGGATAIGAAAGPVGSTEPPHHVADTAAHGSSTKDQETGDNTKSTVLASGPGGIEVSKDGYTLDIAEELPAGSATPVSFRIVGPDNRAVTADEAAHDQELHLIAVRRDFAGYQHVHPVLGDDGTWSVLLDLTPGTWRLFADFDPSGADTALVLGADVSVAADAADSNGH